MCMTSQIFHKDDTIRIQFQERNLHASYMQVKELTDSFF